MNAFTRGDSSLGHQPHIEAGLRGEALVLESSASIPLNNMARVTLGGWSRWVGGVPLEVRVPGLPISYPCPMRWLSRSKYPIAGTVLPITVDRVDPSILRIEWDQVAEIDDWIAGGHPVFTDPDSAEALCSRHSRRAAPLQPSTPSAARSTSRHSSSGRA